METREQIIQLGKLLAEEQRQGYQDRAVVGGLDRYLADWARDADSALEHAAVRSALSLLSAYERQPLNTRQERLDRALEKLRGLFRKKEVRADRVDRADRADRASASGSVVQGDGLVAVEVPPLAPLPDVQTAKPARKKTSSKKATPKEKIEVSQLGPEHLAVEVGRLANMGRNAAAFKRLGVYRIEDLLYHFPHRYDDYSSQKTIATLEIGAVETIVAKVADANTFTMRNGRSAIELYVQDGSGRLKVVFFGGSHWMLKQFSFGRKLVVSGKVTLFQGQRQMNNPDWEPYSDDELVHTGRLVPVHPLTKGLHERNARIIIKQVVDQVAPELPDHLAPASLERNGLLPLGEALQQIHFPRDAEMLERSRLRLGFDEFLLIQLGVIQRRLRWQSEMGYPLEFRAEVHEAFLETLPFVMTGAQARALDEIFADLALPVPMARLLQGDVGSGKTVVAAAALLQAIANGFQGALMAPTEILAEQHYKGLRKLLGQVAVPRDKQAEAEAENPGGDWRERLSEEDRARLEEVKRLLGMQPEDDMDGQGVRVALLTGSLGAKERRKVLEGIAKGDVDLVIGTHALITEGVQYQSLGLVCIDEQHRFGVEQRERLKQKGFNPHMLVMTATPIPRTLTLTIYGELATSVLDELPPGRQEIQTRWITRAERYKAYKHIRREVEKGRQAFVICPLVEESEKIDLPSAEEMHTLLQYDVFPDLRIGLIHGRLMGREKDQAMRQFRDREYDVLVATAVVEVGIDIPNATTIVIDGAERFGLAQLHQFRGRVGRGEHQSYCVLISDVENESTTQRLEAMEQTRDGFKLAEIDLELRGPGEFLGRRQSGTPDLKIARLADTHLLISARREAQTILEEDPELARSENTQLHRKLVAFWKDAEGAS